MTNQQKLARAAKEALHYRVRKAAVRELTDRTLFVYITKNEKNFSVRKAAVKKLTDQTLLACIAKNDKEDVMRRAAAENLIVLIEELIHRNQFKEAPEDIYLFNSFSDGVKISLARALIKPARESGPPLNAQWAVIKKWVEPLHYDVEEGRCDNHNDIRGWRLLSQFPPYPVV
jgi:hypothetical protein